MSETLWDYSLHVWVSVCKRISLDDQYFMVNFWFENLDLAVRNCLENKVKNTNIFAFRVINSLFHCDNLTIKCYFSMSLSFSHCFESWL